LYCILVNPDLRDEYLHKIQEKGIGVAVNFRPIHLMKYYREKYGYKIWDFPNAEYIWSWVIALPLYPKLTSEEWAYVISSINEVIHA
jgi:dTDP-4-amino-4,6-dideoxygalactose transaminase